MCKNKIEGIKKECPENPDTLFLKIWSQAYKPKLKAALIPINELVWLSLDQPS